MFSRLLILFTCMIVVNACNASDSRELIKSVPVTNTSHRYEIERLSFLAPAGVGWESVDYENSGSIRFQNIKDGTRIMYVNVNPFQDHLNSDGFDSFIAKKLEEAAKVQTKIDSKNYGKSGMKFYKAKVLNKAGMRCITKEVLRENPVNKGMHHQVTYYCRQPNQPADFPPIEISFSDAYAPGLDSDPDAILAPIWSSLQFKPVDRETSRAYQNWKVKNAAFRKRQ